MKVKILGTGSHLPERVLTNAHLEQMVETNDAWIVERTGIRERHIAAPGEPTSDLAAAAARRALEASGTRPEDVDMILVATSSPDRLIPPTAAVVQAKLGCWNAGACDLIAACSGFTYALTMGRGLVASGVSRRCLIIGAEKLSSVTNFKDRGTCILLADGAGAVVLGPSEDDSDILYSKLGCDGRMADLLVTPVGGTAAPVTAEAIEQNLHCIQMKGREVYKFAVPKFVEMVQEGLAACKLQLSDIRALLPHQMNARMIEAVAERLSLPMDRVILNIERTGNTSAASIPIALDEAVRAGRIRRGDLLLMIAMGAGITWGTVLLKW